MVTKLHLAVIEQPSNLSTVALLTKKFIMFKNIHNIIQAGSLTLFFTRAFLTDVKMVKINLKKSALTFVAAKLKTLNIDRKQQL